MFFQIRKFIVFLIVFCWIFKGIVIPPILENEHLVYTRRSFSQDHPFRFGSVFWCNFDAEFVAKWSSTPSKIRVKKTIGFLVRTFNDFLKKKMLTKPAPNGVQEEAKKEQKSTQNTILYPRPAQDTKILGFACHDYFGFVRFFVFVCRRFFGLSIFLFISS